jgi:hypothetical protein
LAMAAEVTHLILYHHDPERTDHELDSIQEDARAWFAWNEPSITCTAAFEGLALDLCTERTVDSPRNGVKRRWSMALSGLGKDSKRPLTVGGVGQLSL